MMLVLETNGGLVHLFTSSTEAEFHLEALDVANREYEFCDEAGQRFVGEIVSPVTAFCPGDFKLRPDGAPDMAVLDSVLLRPCRLERACCGVRSLDDLRRLHGS